MRLLRATARPRAACHRRSPQPAAAMSPPSADSTASIVGHRALIDRAPASWRAALGLRGMLLSFEPLPLRIPARSRTRRRGSPTSASAGACCRHTGPRCAVPAALRRARCARCGAAQFLALLRGAGRAAGRHRPRLPLRPATARRCGAGAAPARHRSGLGVEVVAPVMVGAERVSSQRRCARRWPAATWRGPRSWLGRRYSMRGRVRARRSSSGAQLGFPTANLRLARRRSPLDGYLCGPRARCLHCRRRAAPGVASLGTRPTVDGVEPLLEAHVFDFDGDLYGREIEVEFVAQAARRAEVRERSTPWSSRCTATPTRRAHCCDRRDLDCGAS